MARKLLNGLAVTGNMSVASVTSTSGNPTAVLVTGAADTGQTASTEKVDIDFNLGRTVQFASGALATQRACLVRAPTYAFVSASTIATAATVAITGAPIAGTNATITASLALWVQSGNVRFDSFTTTLNAGTTTVNTACAVAGSIADFLQYDVKNTSTGTGAQSGYSATADNGTPTTGFAFMGINNSGTPLVAAYNIGAANDVNFMGSGQDVYLANTNNTKSIFVSLGKAAAPYFFNVFEFGNNSGVGKIVATTATVTWTQTATTGTTAGFLATGAAHTALTASTESIDVNWNLSRTVQWATGAISTQRAFVVQAPTYAFVGASTVTTAATFVITGAPVAGTNATITNALSLWMQSGTAQFDGSVQISPSASTGSPRRAFTTTAAAHTALTASTEYISFLHSAATQQFSAGALATQRFHVVNAPTYAFVSASVITNAATFAIAAAPSAGTNATITNSMALWVQSGAARFDGGALVSTGTAAAPGLAFFGDSNTGVYSVGADQIGVSTGGVLRFDVSTTAVTSTLPFVAPASTASSASTRQPHGTAPTSPVNGDEWTTTVGKFVRINGVTYNMTRLVFALTDAAIIAVDAAVGDVFTVTLAGNRTMGAPTNPIDGRTALFRVRQDATGSRTLTWNAAFAFATNLPVPVLSTAANKVDYVGFIYNGVTAKWECLSYLLGHN